MRFIVRPLAGCIVTYILVARVYWFARPEAYLIVDTSEDARASHLFSAKSLVHNFYHRSGNVGERASNKIYAYLCAGILS